MSMVARSGLLSRFSCLGDTCPDTCCQKWSMQVDSATIERYRTKAPELLEAVEEAKEAPFIMRKDPASGSCVKLEGGLCSIHRDYGAGMLGDACYFYPRIMRRLGSETLMSATLSCPEIARLALTQDVLLAYEASEEPRLPADIKDYLPEGMQPADALQLHALCLQAAQDKRFTAEMNLLRLHNVAGFLARIEPKDWKAALPLYLERAHERLMPAQAHDSDAFNLLHALCGLAVATRKAPSEAFLQVVSAMETALHVKIDWQNVAIEGGQESLSARERVSEFWRKGAGDDAAPLLRRWLAGQLSAFLFPFAGLGEGAEQKLALMGVRLATFRLALMSLSLNSPSSLTPEVGAQVAYALSRLFDHLADAGYSLQIYQETGWVNPARLRAILEI